ncbi:MAG TPA: TetR/AcrR family transcriptional regulator [Solirubrobacteraceae bacterium]|nr:TetR/AcrR family transcriptional regulator [Solirubrobacteraceae bacterium]
MIIPVTSGADRECTWATLDAAAKRERLLCAAGEVFASEGLDASMPAVAAAAGAGVASIYRQFPSKHDLLAALVVRRLDQIAAEAADATASPCDRFEALEQMLRKMVERDVNDGFMGEAHARVAAHPDVGLARDRATDALALVLDEARAEGRLRPDATPLDLRLLFAATRAAKQVEPTAWRRTLELFIDSLRRA